MLDVHKSKSRICHLLKDGIYRKRITFFSEREVEMQDLNLIMAKYYSPNELFVGQVEEIIDMLTERLAERFPRIQAVNKANHIVAKYYLNIPET